MTPRRWSQHSYVHKLHTRFYVEIYTTNHRSCITETENTFQWLTFAFFRISKTTALQDATRKTWICKTGALGAHSPSSGLTGSCFIFISSRFVFSSLRRSFLLPTRMIGTFGQKCFTCNDDSVRRIEISANLHVYPDLHKEMYTGLKTKKPPFFDFLG